MQKIEEFFSSSFIIVTVNNLLLRSEKEDHDQDHDQEELSVE